MACRFDPVPLALMVCFLPLGRIVTPFLMRVCAVQFVPFRWFSCFAGSWCVCFSLYLFYASLWFSLRGMSGSAWCNDILNESIFSSVTSAHPCFGSSPIDRLSSLSSNTLPSAPPLFQGAFSLLHALSLFCAFSLSIPPRVLFLPSAGHPVL